MFKIDIEGVNPDETQESLKEVSEAKDEKDREIKEDKEITEEHEVGKHSHVSDDKGDRVEDIPEQEEKPAKTSAPDRDKEKYWSKLKKERAEKQQLTERLEQLQQEKLQMEQMLASAINTGSTHYKNNVASELEMAQARLQLALESGDAAGVSRATADISKATHALNEASRIAHFPPKEYSEEHLNQVWAREYEDRLYSWLDNNPEVDKNAPEYDEKLAGGVLSFIRKLDRKYETTNKGHLIGSSSYYGMIDEYIDNLKMQDNSASIPAKHFGAVRSRVQSMPETDKTVRVLTPAEKRAALAFGQTDEQYLKHLAQYPKEMRLK